MEGGCSSAQDKSKLRTATAKVKSNRLWRNNKTFEKELSKESREVEVKRMANNENQNLTVSDVDQEAKPQIHQPSYYELSDFPSLGHVEKKQRPEESRSQNVACIIRRVQSPLAEGQVRQGRFVCRFCSGKFIDKSQAMAHTGNCPSRRNLPVLFKAKNKPEGTTIGKSRNGPIQVDEERGVFNCSACKRALKSGEGLKDNERSQGVLRLLPICSSPSRRLAAEKTTAVKISGANKGEDIVEDDVSAGDMKDEKTIPASQALPAKCRKCPLKFLKGEELSSHENGHEGKDPLLCLVCGKWFRFSRQLQTHTKEYHSFLQLFNL